MTSFPLPTLNRSSAISRIATILGTLPGDKAFRVSVEEAKPKRSNQQNRYLFGVVYPTMLKHLPGWDRDDVHEWCLGECFGWEQLEGLGRLRVKPIKRSAKLSTTEFSDFIAFIQRRAAEFGIFIPDPEEEFA